MDFKLLGVMARLFDMMRHILGNFSDISTFHDHAERRGEEGPDGQPGPGPGQGEEAGEGGHGELVRPQVVHTHRPRQRWTAG